MQFDASPGDANCDGSVDGTDLNIVLSNYGVTSGATWAMGDFNGDGPSTARTSTSCCRTTARLHSVTAAVPEPCYPGSVGGRGPVGLLAYAWRKRK